MAYVRKDGLWFQDLAGGEARKVASGGLTAPKFAPSGRWIAYQRGDAVHVVSVRGQGDIELGAAYWPGYWQWWRNKDELLLADHKHVVSFAAASGWRENKQWTSNATPPFVFSPDGAEMVYADEVDSGRNEYGNPARTGRLCRLALSAPGGSPQVLLSEYDTGQEPCLWTRHDSILFYKDPSFSGSIRSDGLELFSMPAAGGRPRSLGICTLVYDDWLSLSPTHDALAICDGDSRGSYSNKRIAVLDLSNNSVRYLTDRKTVAVKPSWSPDRKLIAYSAAPEPQSSDQAPDPILSQRRIWLADPAGVQAPRRLTGDDRYRDEEPIWLADGQHILFCRVDGAKQRTLWMMRADGTVPRWWLAPSTLIPNKAITTDTFTGPKSWTYIPATMPTFD